MTDQPCEENGLVFCFGDSLTFGPPGIPYIRYFQDKERYRNHGIGGDTLTGMTERILPFLEDPENREFIIGIGTNDLLLPHMESRSEPWRLAVELMIRGGKVILRDIESFERAYAFLMDRVAETGKSATVFNMPCIGEDVDSELNLRADEYNRIIRRICEERAITFVDFKTFQKRRILKHGGQNPYLLSEDPTKAVRDAFWTALLPFTERVARSRGLHMTVDGVHLNHASARLLARLIEKAREVARAKPAPES
ncbi:MAG: SGNH/GDSL hydrolase family protein [Clostridia bacterium]|nr:SGNH/GDSL hydrolase family protein [Clostridia bacterium]